MQTKKVSAADLRDIVMELVAAGSLPKEIAGVPITGNTLISDLGIDSIGWVNLAVEIADRSDVLVPDNILKPRMTLDDLAAALNAPGAR